MNEGLKNIRISFVRKKFSYTFAAAFDLLNFYSI